MITVWKQRVDAIAEAKLEAERERQRIRSTTFPLRTEPQRSLLDPVIPLVPSETRQVRRRREMQRMGKVKLYKHQADVLRDFGLAGMYGGEYTVIDEKQEMTPLSMSVLEAALEEIHKPPKVSTHFVSPETLRAMKGQP